MIRSDRAELCEQRLHMARESALLVESRWRTEDREASFPKKGGGKPPHSR
jgi:hypothetical protein